MRRDELKGQHMNTHVPQVIGAARRYELSSDYRFADVARFFFETVSESRTYATGGSSNNEHWLTSPNHLAIEMHISSHHQECCCSYNMMKLARHLYSWSADSRLIDYYERNLVNHRLGAIEPETGHTTYFLSLAPGAWKTTCTEDATFWCCTGTGVEEFAKLNDTIYAHDDDSLFVNLYFASTVNWKERGVRLKQTTTFPESERTELTIEKTPAKAWTLRLRIPAWTTAENFVAINGKRLEAAGTPGSYFDADPRMEGRRSRGIRRCPCGSRQSRWPTTARSRRSSTGRWCWPGSFPKPGSRKIWSTIRDRRFRRRPRWTCLHSSRQAPIRLHGSSRFRARRSRFAPSARNSP